MLIGQVADAFGIPTRTVRFYDRKGPSTRQLTSMTAAYPTVTSDLGSML